MSNTIELHPILDAVRESDLFGEAVQVQISLAIMNQVKIALESYHERERRITPQIFLEQQKKQLLFLINSTAFPGTDKELAQRSRQQEIEVFAIFSRVFLNALNAESEM